MCWMAETRTRTLDRCSSRTVDFNVGDPRSGTRWPVWDRCHPHGQPLWGAPEKRLLLVRPATEIFVLPTPRCNIDSFEEELGISWNMKRNAPSSRKRCCLICTHSEEDVFLASLTSKRGLSSFSSLTLRSTRSRASSPHLHGLWNARRGLPPLTCEDLRGAAACLLNPVCQPSLNQLLFSVRHHVASLSYSIKQQLFSAVC